MNDDDQIPDEAVRIISLLTECLKESTKWLALCTAALGFYLASPLSKHKVELIPLNPMFVVDAERFSNGIASAVLSGNLSATVAAELNKSLNAELGTNVEKIIFYREWYQSIEDPVTGDNGVPAASEDKTATSIRYALKQQKLGLGYDDKDTRGNFGRSHTYWD